MLGSKGLQTFKKRNKACLSTENIPKIFALLPFGNFFRFKLLGILLVEPVGVRWKKTEDLPWTIKSENSRCNKRLTLETSALETLFTVANYITNSFDKNKLSSYTPTDAASEFL